MRSLHFQVGSGCRPISLRTSCRLQEEKERESWKLCDTPVTGNSQTRSVSSLPYFNSNAYRFLVRRAACELFSAPTCMQHLFARNRHTRR